MPVRPGVDPSDRASIVAAVAVWSGAALVPDVGPIVVVGAAGVAVLRVFGRRGGAAMAALVVVAVAAGSILAVRSLAGLHPAELGSVRATVTLVTDPEPGYSDTLRFDVTLDGKLLLAEAERPQDVAALERALSGQRVAVVGSVEAIEERRPWMTARHVAGRLHIDHVVGVGAGSPVPETANRFRRVLVSGAASLGADQQALFTGLVLGDDRAQSESMASDFRAAGLTHLLAVSGENVVLLLAMVGLLLRRLRLWPRAICAVSVVLAFGLVTRFEPSVVRASAVAVVAIAASTLGRRSTAMRHLALAVVGLVLIDPLLTRSVGFQLSVAASAGIVLWASAISARLVGPTWFREALGVTVAAQLAVAPVLVPTFGPQPLVALLANVAAGPVAGAVMTWGMTAGLVAGVIGGPAAALLHVPTAAGTWVLALVARVAASAPIGRIDGRHLVVLLCGIVVTRLATRTAARTDGIADGTAGAGPERVETRRVGAGRRGPMALAGVVLAGAALLHALTLGVPAGGTTLGRTGAVWSNGLVAVVDLDDDTSARDVLDALAERRVRRVALMVVRSPSPDVIEVAEIVAARYPPKLVLGPRSDLLGDRAVTVPGTGERYVVAGMAVTIVEVGARIDARLGWVVVTRR